MTKTAHLVVSGDQAKHNRVHGRRGAALRSAAALLALVAIFAGPASAESFGSATFHALVSPTGVVARGSGVKAVTHPSVGRYLVQFRRSVNVSTCVYTATPHGAYGGQASVQVVPGKPDTIAVFTFSKAGVPANLYFNLLVSCGDEALGLGTTIMSASVHFDGSLLGGSGAVSSSYDSFFKVYTVQFNRSIIGCASVVTPQGRPASVATFQNEADDPLSIQFMDDIGRVVIRVFHVIVFCP